MIQRKKQEIARLVSPPMADWRENMNIQPKLLCSEEEIIKPMEDIWEEYS